MDTYGEETQSVAKFCVEDAYALKKLATPEVSFEECSMLLLMKQ